jgi:hypothetical protein
MRPIFRCFCINRFGIDPLHYISSCSDFGFELMEIFVGEKRLPDLESRGAASSPARRFWGVADSPTRRVGESAIECLSVSWRVVDSPTRQVKESLTPRLSELGESLW